LWPPIDYHGNYAGQVQINLIFALYIINLKEWSFNPGLKIIATFENPEHKKPIFLGVARTYYLHLRMYLATSGC
jgi:hypothetical protein